MISRSTGRTRKQSDPALAEYERKRDFEQTSEPPARAARAHGQPIFVIQEHHARRLHYDFRLEADGVLKSWAVTKTPSLDPGVRRLAVRTEDHPLAYATFAGEIPEGQYGAGQVEIWDNGSYENLSGRPLSEALAQGKAEIELHGGKLKGKYVLVRLAGAQRGENWLLIKMKDAYARAARPTEPPRRVRSKPAAKVSRGGTVVRPVKATTTLPFELKHLAKVLYPAKGFTKEDVVRFYAAVAPLLLPHLRDRPMTLERLPDGVRPEAPHFWQKHTPSYYPDWIERFEAAGAGRKPVSYALVNDQASLLYLVNQGTLTFHPWLSRLASLDQPDFVLFDLDPGEAGFGAVVKIAKQLHATFEAEGLDNFVKTSGKTGLHVLVPWTRPGGYEEARAWALSVAKATAAALSDIATVERSKSARGSKAYIDVMQNARGHHVVPPYVLRAVPAGTVSTPLAWEELTSRTRPEQFDLETALKRFERQKQDPMRRLTGAE